MIPDPPVFVVDASVGIKVVLKEDLSARADALVELAARDEVCLHVPGLFFLECANILWKRTWRDGYPPEQAQADLRDLRALPWRVTPAADLAGDALDIALAVGASAYDACYLALARQLSAPFVTADERLIRRLSGSAFDAHWLGDLDTDAILGGEATP